MISLTISVVSGRSEENMKKCLDTLKKAMPENVKPLLIATDNCTGWNLELLAKSFYPNAEIIFNNAPKGFGANHNQALLERKDDFGLIINDDIEIAPDALKNLLELAEKKEKGAAFGPILFPASWDADYISAGGKTGEGLYKRSVLSCQAKIY
jgi:GT2 family glycosyltransferase